MNILPRTLKLLVCATIALATTMTISAHDQKPVKVVPEKEYKIAQDSLADGPTETTGIESSKALGSILLASEFEGMAGHKIRVREVTVLPGGQVAVHQHTSRPGAAYILEGEMIEHRNDTTEALTRRVGDVAFEKTGTIHWWENKSDKNARVLVFDIVSVDEE